MKVLSLFDGMACGMLALQGAGVPVDRYVAFEIDKYAVQTSTHNFPMIEHRGDVFGADFTEFHGFDFLVGGSPCTYWSIAQKNNRETEASGIGWELFQQYVRALHEARPKFFVYENNKSMSKAIRESIDHAFGFGAVEINSARVSAQNRQRVYWVGKRNADGTYSRVNVEQPEDRGILLVDVLMSAYPAGMDENGKAYCLISSYQFGVSPHDTLGKCRRSMAAEPVRIPEYGNKGKSRPVTWSYAKQGLGQIAKNCFPENPNKQLYDYVAEPCAPKELTDREIDYMFRTPERTDYGYIQRSTDDKAKCITANIAKGVPYNCIFEKFNCDTPPWYAAPCEWDENGRPVKAVSAANGRTYIVYEVKDGQITIKGKQYPIKLPDGFYIIRKLTVRECMYLQTVPVWYAFPVSDTQAYKMLGNGWTVEVIKHLILSALADDGDDWML